jgi:tetratricopeptide (TPR) repeat protein
MAFIELRRFDEAIAAGKKAQRQNPSYSAAYRCLASAFAHLGRDAEAREAAARVLETDPALPMCGNSPNVLSAPYKPQSAGSSSARNEIYVSNIAECCYRYEWTTVSSVGREID